MKGLRVHGGQLAGKQETKAKANNTFSMSPFRMWVRRVILFFLYSLGNSHIGEGDTYHLPQTLRKMTIFTLEDLANCLRSLAQTTFNPVK